MRRIPVVTILLLLAVATPACGGGSSKKNGGASSTNTTAAIQLPPPRDKPSATGGTAAPGPSSSAPTTAAPAGDHGPEAFTSPSGNIGCFIDAASARCDINQRAWQPPPKPAGCDLDYGQGLLVSGDHADFVCAGDTVLGQGPQLPFGSSSQRGAVICESATAGITCHETRNGHGFFISRESYRLF